MWNRVWELASRNEKKSSEGKKESIFRGLDVSIRHDHFEFLSEWFVIKVSFSFCSQKKTTHINMPTNFIVNVFSKWYLELNHWLGRPPCWKRSEGVSSCCSELTRWLVEALNMANSKVEIITKLKYAKLLLDFVFIIFPKIWSAWTRDLGWSLKLLYTPPTTTTTTHPPTTTNFSTWRRGPRGPKFGM